MMNLPIDDLRSELAAPILCVESSYADTDRSEASAQHQMRKRAKSDAAEIWHAQMKQHLPDCLIVLRWPDADLEALDDDAKTLATILDLQTQIVGGRPRLKFRDDIGGAKAMARVWRNGPRHAICYLEVDTGPTSKNAEATVSTAMEHWPIEHSIMPGIREHRVTLRTPVPIAREMRPTAKALQGRQRFFRSVEDGAVHLSGIGGPTMTGSVAPKDLQIWRLRDEDRSMNQVISPGYCFTVDARRRRLVHGKCYLVCLNNRFRVRRWKGDRSPKGWASWSSSPDVYPLMGIQGTRDVERYVIGEVVEVYADLDRSRRSVGAPPLQFPSVD